MRVLEHLVSNRIRSTSLPSTAPVLATLGLPRILDSVRTDWPWGSICLSIQNIPVAGFSRSGQFDE